MSKEKEGEEGEILADQIFKRIAALNSDHGPVLGHLVRCLGFLVLYILWGDLSTDLSADEPTSRETTDSKIAVSERVNSNNTAVFVAVRRLLHVRPYRVHYSRCGLFFTCYIRYFQLPGGDPLLHISRKDILLTWTLLHNELSSWLLSWLHPAMLWVTRHNSTHRNTAAISGRFCFFLSLQKRKR